MFAGWNTLDFVVAGLCAWPATGIAFLGFLAFIRDLDERYGPKAKVYDFTTEARKRRSAA